MKINVRRKPEVAEKFEKLLASDSYDVICRELRELCDEKDYIRLSIVGISGNYMPGNLFTWLVMNGISTSYDDTIKAARYTIEIEDGVLGLAGPASIPFFQPNLI